MRKNIIRILCVLMVLLSVPQAVQASSEDLSEKNAETQPSIGIEAPHAVLMEASTGEILYEKDAHTASAPASVTKIMTMLLIFDALEIGKIKLEDPVVVSERAASMGGSQVYLEENEKQTVETMLKCISIASGNDACVAMAEHLYGSEEAFVTKMNERAKGLGMEQSHFVNCHGLDADGHEFSAYDVALMSRELLTKYPQIHDYCTVWMDTITHTTARGSSEFGLSNTNKLIRQYEYCTGLKTGSTGKAGFCVSATAQKDEMELIAVVMNGETSKSRFQDAVTMLNYGYANFRIYRDTDEQREPLEEISVTGGVKMKVQLVYEKEFSYLLMNGENITDVERRLELPEEVKAPVETGQPLGMLTYYHGNEKLGEIQILAQEEIKAAGYMDYVKRVWLAWMM